METTPYIFDPTTSNWNNLEHARNNMSNMVWRDIYDSLLTCRKNVVSIQPLEYLSIPINGEPSITINNTPVEQLWCRNLMIKDILNDTGDWKTTNDYTY